MCANITKQTTRTRKYENRRAIISSHNIVCSTYLLKSNITSLREIIIYDSLTGVLGLDRKYILGRTAIPTIRKSRTNHRPTHIISFSTFKAFDVLSRIIQDQKELHTVNFIGKKEDHRTTQHRWSRKNQDRNNIRGIHYINKR